MVAVLGKIDNVDLVSGIDNCDYKKKAVALPTVNQLNLVAFVAVDSEFISRVNSNEITFLVKK